MYSECLLSVGGTLLQNILQNILQNTFVAGILLSTEDIALNKADMELVIKVGSRQTED